MTVIIGFTCKDGIVMACESQITGTHYSTTSKLVDGNKIQLVEFSNGGVMTAQSGSVLYSQQFVDEFKKRAADKEIVDEWTVRDTAQQAMRHVQNDLLAEWKCPPESFRDRLLNEVGRVECMFAFYSGDQPFVFTITLHHATPQPMRGQFVAIGSGDALANYLLDTNLTPDIPENHACLLAAHVVDTVKKYDSGCDGRTKVSSLRIDRDSETVDYNEMDPEVIEGFSRAYAIADAESRNIRNGAIADLMDEWWKSRNQTSPEGE